MTLAFCQGKSWPTKQSVVGYPSDLKQSRLSAPNLVELLEFLAAETDAENVHLLSYSAAAPMLSAGLVTLRERYPDKAQVVLLRYFGGLTTDETAKMLGVSAPTVERHWRYARAWLKHRLSEKQ